MVIFICIILSLGGILIIDLPPERNEYIKLSALAPCKKIGQDYQAERSRHPD